MRWVTRSKQKARLVREDMIRTAWRQVECVVTRCARNTKQNLPKNKASLIMELCCHDRSALHAIPDWQKKSAAELKEAGVLDNRYETIRSCLKAPPGWLLVECDYNSAELFVLAGLSGDKALLAILMDPNRDLHSEIAVRGFKLPCEMKDAKEYVKKHEKKKRDAAKAVVYGLIYGRGPAAVERAMQKDGIYDFTRKDAEALQEAVLGAFPKVKEFIQKCQDAVDFPGYVENPFGRRRYFPQTTSDTVRAKQKRQAVNAPIQGSVADVLKLAEIAFRNYQIEHNEYRFLVVLPVHDQLDFFVRPDFIEEFMTVVQPLCMCEIPRIPGLDFALKSETDVGFRMAEPYADDKESGKKGWEIARDEALPFWKKDVASVG